MNQDILFLKELQNELKTQETDGQTAPRYWSIMDYKWVVTDDGYHERVSIYFYDSADSITLEDYVYEEILKDRIDDFTEFQIEELKEAHEWDGCDGVLEWIHENDTKECRLVYEEEISFIAYNTCFLTKAEAKSHLESNGHHYSGKAHTFAMTAWRAPKMERLINILETFDWDQLINKDRVEKND